MAISIAGGIKSGKIVEIEHMLYQQLIVGIQQENSQTLSVLDRELEADAYKIDVERKAMRARFAKKAEEKEIFDAISGQLVRTVSNAIEHQLVYPHLALTDIDINEQQVLLLELLIAKNIDVSRIKPIIASLSWLANDLLNVINGVTFEERRPKYIKQGRSDIAVILTCIGIENLRSMIPYLCVRNWMPKGNAKLRWITRKLWRYTMTSAIATSALAQLHEDEDNAALAYSGALLNQLGISVVLSLGARQFDLTWNIWAKEAFDNRDKIVHDAVLATELPAQTILEHVVNHSSALNWQLLEALKFPNSPLTLLMKELDQTLTYRDLSPAAALVAQGSCFAKVMQLQDLNHITPKEAQLMFDYYELSKRDVMHLKKQNYKKLDVF